MLLLALALCLLLLVPPAANADWSAPFDVSAPGSSRREARVAVDPSGAAVVTWLARDGAAAVVQARRIAADGTLGPILDLSPAGRLPARPDVAIDDTGHATVVWSDRASTGVEEIVRARGISAGGALEPTIDLTGPGLTSKLPKVAVAPSGAVTVIWLRTPVGTVHLRRIDPAGGPGATLDLSPPVSSQADLAVDADGDAYVAWATAGGGDQLIHGRWVDAGGDLEDVETLTDDLVSFDPHVTLDAAGTPTVAWLREDDSIQLRRGLGATTEVAPAGTADTFGDLAVDGAGNATVVWIGPSGSSRAAFLRRLPAAGAAGPVNDLWSGGDDHDPRLALDGAGTPTLIWGNETPTESTVRARTAPPGAPFGPIADLWPVATGTSAGEPEVASAGGVMTAVWRRVDATEEAIVAARFTTAAPAPAQFAPAPPPPSSEGGGPSAPPVAAAVARCRVPKVKGLTLAKARRRLVRAGCKIGKVKRPRGARRQGRRLVVKSVSGTRSVTVRLVWRPR